MLTHLDVSFIIDSKSKSNNYLLINYYFDNPRQWTDSTLAISARAVDRPKLSELHSMDGGRLGVQAL